MTPTRRGRAVGGVLVFLLVVGVAVVGVLYLGGRSGVGPLADEHSTGASPGAPGYSAPPPPTQCPLTARKPHGHAVPNRPALAVKIENVPAARPQTGLSWADIVYEEPVEANITRFIAVYQCDDAERIEPVRSGRLTDPDILVQFGRPVFGYAGGVAEVYRKVAAAGLIDVNFNKPNAAAAYHRDPARLAPHNLYTSTHELYAAAHTTAGAPSPVFTYSARVPSSARPVNGIHVPFSSYSDVIWKWSASTGRWLRFHGAYPHTLSDGTQVSATNVVVQVVRVFNTDIHDVNGVVSPEVVATGSGPCYVLRNGRLITGTWKRASLHDVTKFYDASGAAIPLMPGKTWVELAPTTIPVSSF